jgi:hypothetical protein
VPRRSRSASHASHWRRDRHTSLVARIVGMLAAINFDDNPMTRRREVSDERTNRNLRAKRHTREASIAKDSHMTRSVSVVSPQDPRRFDLLPLAQGTPPHPGASAPPPLPQCGSGKNGSFWAQSPPSLFRIAGEGQARSARVRRSPRPQAGRGRLHTAEHHRPAGDGPAAGHAQGVVVDHRDVAAIGLALERHLTLPFRRLGHLGLDHLLIEV